MSDWAIVVVGGGACTGLGQAVSADVLVLPAATGLQQNHKQPVITFFTIITFSHWYLL
jgi:uncharacterized protein YjlB